MTPDVLLRDEARFDALRPSLRLDHGVRFAVVEPGRDHFEPICNAFKR